MTLYVVLKHVVLQHAALQRAAITGATFDIPEPKGAYG